MSITQLILFAVGALALIGALSAVLLATAAQKFHVDIDPRVQAILDVLPGANCGACGQAGCFSAAEAMAAEKIPPTGCVAGGQSVADHVASVMGKDVCDVEARVALRHCGGGTASSHAYIYAGAESCNAASKFAGGEVACPYGCLGHGDCLHACPFGAITLDDRRLPVIDLEKCTGCGVCVPECPRGVLALVPDTMDVVVRCGAHQKVPARRQTCPNSCIVCRKCEKACPSEAIQMIDNLAVVDPEKCTGCYSCVEVCPQDCIDVTGINAPKSAAVLDGKSRDFEGFASSAPKSEAPEAVGAASEAGEQA